MSRGCNTKMARLAVCAAFALITLTTTGAMATVGAAGPAELNTGHLLALRTGDGVSLLPDGATLDRLAWESGLLVAYITIPESASQWKISDPGLETLTEALSASVGDVPDHLGTIVRFRAGRNGDYGSASVFDRNAAAKPAGTPEPQETPIPLAQVIEPEQEGLRGLGGPTAQASGQPVGALTGVVIYTSAGHGWTAGEDYWYLQRPVLLNMAEDYGNIDQLNYFVHYAFNAGATIVPFRPVGWQSLEIVLDNDDPAVTYTGTWTDGNGSKYFENNVTVSGVPYRWTSADSVESAVVRYTPTVTVSDFYPVYCFAMAAANRTLQTYRISHSGGMSEVKVDHRMVGNGWIWLGTYYLEAGGDNYVEITNLATETGAVIADAIRWGSGIGDIPRTSANVVSGYPRDEECSRYWAHSQLGNNAVGFDGETIWNHIPDDDGASNVRVGAHWAREMNQEPVEGVLVDRWKRIYYEFHTNATNGVVRGCIALISNDGVDYIPTTYQAQYAAMMADEIDADMLLLQSEFEHTWFDRSSPTYTSQYGAICQAANSDEFDATIIELAFHDQEQDAQLLRDPRVRAAMAKSSVQGIIRFLNWLPGSQIPLAFPPDTPRNVAAVDAGNGDVTLTWTAPLADGARGDPATGYKVYESANGYGFGSPTVLGNVLTITLSGLPVGETRYYRVAATNAGGESMPSEVLAVRRPATGQATVLIVNGFDRLRRDQNPIQDFTQPPDYAGKFVERQQWRKSNSYDYVITHAEALAAALPETGFSSCANEAVSAGPILLDDYDVVVWISGEESTEDATFDSTEQTKVQSFLINGGALFVTGSDLGYDLDDQNHGRTFYETKLMANYVARDAGTYEVTGAAGSILSGIGSFDFDPANGTPYDADRPDQIAAQAGAVAALSYVGGTGGTAAVQYEGTCGRYRVMMFAFPFETISSAAKRAEVMATVIPWLQATPGPVPFDVNGDCQVTLADYNIFRVCLELSGPVKPFAPGHMCINTYHMDQDGDLDVDMEEFSLFQELFGSN